MMKRLPAMLIGLTVLVTLFVFRLTDTTSPVIWAQEPAIKQADVSAPTQVDSVADPGDAIRTWRIELKGERSVSIFVGLLRVLFADELAQNALQFDVDADSRMITAKGKLRLLDRVESKVGQLQSPLRRSNYPEQSLNYEPPMSTTYRVFTDATALAATLQQRFAAGIADKVLSFQADTADNTLIITGISEAVSEALKVARKVDRGNTDGNSLRAPAAGADELKVETLETPGLVGAGERTLQWTLKRAEPRAVAGMLQKLFRREFADGFLHFIQSDPEARTITFRGVPVHVQQMTPVVKLMDQKLATAGTMTVGVLNGDVYAIALEHARAARVVEDIESMFHAAIANDSMAPAVDERLNVVYLKGPKEILRKTLDAIELLDQPDRRTPAEKPTTTKRRTSPPAAPVSHSGVEEQLAVFQRKLAEVRLELAQATIEVRQYESTIPARLSAKGNELVNDARLEAALAAHPEIVKHAEAIASAELTMSATDPSKIHHQSAKKQVEISAKRLEDSRRKLLPQIRENLFREVRTQMEEQAAELREKVAKLKELEESIGALIYSSEKELAKATVSQTAEKKRIDAELDATLQDVRERASSDGGADKTAPAILMPFEYLDGSEAVATLSSLYPNLYNAGGIVASGKALWIRADGDVLAAVKNTLREMERLAQSRQSESIVKVFSLNNLRATSLKEMLLALYGNASVGMSVDERSNALIVRGPEDLLREFEAIGLMLDSAAAQPNITAASPNSKPDPDISHQRDREAAAQAKAYRELASKGDAVTEDERLALKAKLRTAVAAAYAARKQLRESEISGLRERLRQLEQQITARDALREQIIDNRVEELLNPEKQWDVPETVPQATVPATSSVDQHPPGNFGLGVSY